MKKYFIDTNVILRFLLHDNEKYYNLAKNYFEEAKQAKTEIILIPEVVFEADYVLRGVYKISKKEVCDILLKFILSPYLNVFDRNILIVSLKKYQKKTIDLFDLYLNYKALDKKAKVLSFDRDFDRI